MVEKSDQIIITARLAVIELLKAFEIQFLDVKSEENIPLSDYPMAPEGVAIVSYIGRNDNVPCDEVIYIHIINVNGRYLACSARTCGAEGFRNFSFGYDPVVDYRPVCINELSDSSKTNTILWRLVTTKQEAQTAEPAEPVGENELGIGYVVQHDHDLPEDWVPEVGKDV